MKNKILLFLVFLAFSSSGHSSELTEMHGSYSKELKNQKKIVGKNQKWLSRKADNEEKVRDLVAQRIWLENRVSQYEKYIETLNANIAELKRKKEELAKVSHELEPYLDSIMERLETFISDDISFLSEERSNRISFLKSSLADYKISSGEKLRRVLEALQIEADYSKNIESSIGNITINDETITAKLIRFGRLGYYFISPDQSRFGFYSFKEGKWVELSKSYKNEIIKAMDISERKRAMDVIYLPVSAEEVSGVN